MKKIYLSIIALAIASIAFLGFNYEVEESPTLYLDASQPINKRVKNLMKQMTLEEKVAQMCQYVGLDHMKQAEKNLSKEDLLHNDAHGFYPGLHHTDIAKMTEEGKIGSFLHVLEAEEANELQKLAQKSRLKIPLLIGIDAIHGNGLYNGATLYPTPITMAASFDPEMVKTIMTQTAKEMRATGSHWAFTPNIDIARDARWGRVGETFGEDPLLVSDLGVASVEGLQQGDFTGNQKVVACIKHLIAGSEPANGLNAAPMDVSERTLREVYLPPYQAAIDAGAYSIMAAHNELNGVPCHQSEWLMNDIMRKEFGFEGFVVSDWLDIERIHKLHRTAVTLDDAFHSSVNAGMDMHMHGPKFLESVVQAVKDGVISKKRIDYACAKILEVKFRLGLFENPFVDIEASKSVLMNETHKATALEAARKGIVLVKNKGGFLPLNGKKYKNILVTGPNANNQSLNGDWSSLQPEDNVVNPLEGLEMIAPKGVNFEYFNSGEKIKRMKDEDIKTAANKAKGKDLVIVFAGENSMRYNWPEKTNGENKGRANINLPGKQLNLVKALHATGTPVVVILISGRPLSTPWIDRNIPAVVNAWEPGNFGGQAIAEVLYGKVNPSGKLPISIPRSVGQIQTIYNHKPSQYFHKYTFEKSGALYPFGFGLSYTKFQYSDVKIANSSISKSGKTTVSVTVKNIGKRDGEEVVQMYIRDDYSSATRPVKELKGYERIALKKGESKTITFDIKPEHLAFYNANMEYGVEAGDFTIMVGSSSKDKDLQTVKLTVRP
ncbi:MAG: glycoside hydrolase family 3 N-terminal domain-containing protein [Saprospiraceae bacterium]